MKLFGIQLGKQPAKDGEDTAPSKDLKQTLLELVNKFDRYRTFIILLAVAGLLGATALRMAHYLDPPPNDQRVSDNLAKIKSVKIDPKAVQRIKDLNASNAKATSSFQGNRTNPFAE